MASLGEQRLARALTQPKTRTRSLSPAPALPLPLTVMNQVSNAPDAWEEQEALRNISDVLRRPNPNPNPNPNPGPNPGPNPNPNPSPNQVLRRPALSQYVWLLLPKGSAHVLRSWHRDNKSRAPPTAAESHTASVVVQRRYRARAVQRREARAVAAACVHRPAAVAPRSQLGAQQGGTVGPLKGGVGTVKANGAAGRQMF